MAVLLSLIVAGLAVGSIYGLIGLGFVFTFRSVGTFNFFHGELSMVSAVTAVLLLDDGMPLAAAIALGVVASVLVALVGERVIFRTLDRAPSFVVMLATAAFGIFILRGIAEGLFGSDARSFPALWSATFSVGDVSLGGRDLVILGFFVVAIAGLAATFRFTQIGRAMRAVGENPEAARVVGISLGRTRAAALGLAGLLGGISGILLAPIISVSPSMGAILTIKAFVVALVGGLTSFRGAVVVGLGLGVSETLVAYYAGSELRDLVAFAVMILALLLFPQGVLATKAVERV